MSDFSRNRMLALVVTTLCLCGGAFASESKLLRDLESYRGYQPPQLDPGYRPVPLPKDKGMHEACSAPTGFIQDNGSYGDVGNLIVKEMTGQGKSQARPEMFFDQAPDKIEDVCKGYKSLSPEVRANFWVYVMAAVATNESGCDPKAKNGAAGPQGNNIAIGLFQTPLVEGGKSPSWRGRGCTTPPPYESAESQVACAMEIVSDLLDGNLCANKKGQYTAFDDNSYWAPLRPSNKEQGAKLTNGTDTLSIIKGFPPCRN